MNGFKPFPYPCEVLTRMAGTIDDGFGNLIPVQGTVDSFCDLQQSRREEPGLGGEASRTTWDLFMPVGMGTILDTADAVRVNGQVYEMVGDPWMADTGSTRVNHVEATVVLTR